MSILLLGFGVVGMISGAEPGHNPVLLLRPPQAGPVEEAYWGHNPFDPDVAVEERGRVWVDEEEEVGLVMERIGELAWAGVIFPDEDHPGLVVLRERLWRTGEKLNMGDYEIQLIFVRDEMVGVRVDKTAWDKPYEIEYPVPLFLIRKYKTWGGPE